MVDTSINKRQWTCSITRLVISQSPQFLALRATKPAFFSGMFSEAEVSEQL